MEGKLIKNNEGHYNLIIKNETVGTTDVVEYETAVNNSLKFKLALNNCFNIEKGYNLTQLVLDYTKDEEKGTDEYYNSQIDFVNGFETAVKIIGDKKFSEHHTRLMLVDMARFVSTKEMRDAWDFDIQKFHRDRDFFIDKQIQSLQQTEWDVEIETNLIQSSIEGEPIWEPKLDGEGCLILKRKVWDRKEYIG